MKSNGLFTQIAIMAVAIGIVFTYVKPTFEEISLIQDDISLHREEQDKVENVKSMLADKMNTLKTVSSEDRRKLVTYMPSTIDEVTILRDIYLITQEAGLVYNEPSYGEMQTPTRKLSARDSEEVSDTVLSLARNFSFASEGEYSDVKKLFALMAQNDYPLEISSVEISSGSSVEVEGGFDDSSKEGGSLSVTIDLNTYLYQPLIDSEISI